MSGFPIETLTLHVRLTRYSATLTLTLTSSPLLSASQKKTRQSSTAPWRKLSLPLVSVVNKLTSPRHCFARNIIALDHGVSYSDAGSLWTSIRRVLSGTQGRARPTHLRTRPLARRPCPRHSQPRGLSLWCQVCPESLASPRARSLRVQRRWQG